MHTRLYLSLFAASMIVGAAGCAVVLGLDERQLDPGERQPGERPIDPGTGTSDDAGTDAPSSVAWSSCTFDDEGFGDPGDEGCWETVALETVLHGASFDGTNGAAFDGRYLYIAPKGGVSITKFDTRSAVADEAAWTTFDAKTELGAILDLAGAVFDGRYVTFVPGSGTVLRYDTSAPFEDPTSWETFAMTKVDPRATDFAGGAYDGQYVYFSPNHGLAIRHDALAALDDGWEVVDLAPIVDERKYFGAVYDGRGVVFPQWTGGHNLRYDTRSSFIASSSWSTFDSEEVTSDTLGFAGGAFDGQFVYLAPSGESVVRIDARASFDSASAWSSFDLAEVTPSSALGFFRGAGFDGRFVFFSPSGTINFRPHRKLARYDTRGRFEEASSWLVTEPGAADVGGASTAVYDGRSLYFSPESGAVFARFAARREAHAVDLPAFYGSFY